MEIQLLMSFLKGVKMRRFLIFAVMLVFITSCCGVFSSLIKEPIISSQVFMEDEHGRIFIPHGINVDNEAKHSGENGIADTCVKSKEYFTNLPLLGANLVRHIWQWEGIEPVRNTWNDAYIERKVKRIKWMNEANLPVVVSVHQDLYSQRYSGNGFPDWTVQDTAFPFECQEPWNLNYTQPAVIKCYTDFWKSNDLKMAYLMMLEKLIHVVDTIPNVIGIDVMNEPFLALVRNFESKIYTEFLYECERLFIGKRVKLFYEPWMGTSSGIMSCLRFMPEVDAVYIPHYYDIIVDFKQPYTELNKISMITAVKIKMNEADRMNVPLLFGEWGISPDSDNFDAYRNDFLDVCDNYRIGWIWWPYDDFAKLSRVYPQKIAGINPTWKHNKYDFELEFDKIECAMPTEIYIPMEIDVSIYTEGQFSRVGPTLYYRPSESNHQKITITWN